MSSLSKTRLKSFKEEVTKELDKKIGALAVEATDVRSLAFRTS